MKTPALILAAAVVAALFFFTACEAPEPDPSPLPTAVTQPSVEEQNKQLANEWIAAVSNHDYTKMATFFADDYVYHPVDSVRGPQKAVNYLKTFIEAFDIKINLKQVVTEGDKLAYHLVVSGKHVGTFAGVPPTNKDIKAESLGIVVIKNGKITEEWEIFEETKLLQQIGALPPSNP